MAIVTELELTPHAIVGGEKMRVHPYTLNNAHLHQVMEVVSRLQLGVLESDSNNSSGFLIAEDAQAINKAWSQVMFEWETAKRFRNLAPASIEKTYTVLAITDNEIMRCVNVKCRRVVQALSTLIYKVVYCQSARTQYGIADDDVQRIEKHLAYIKYLVDAYVSTGAEKDDGSADTGMNVADYPYLGTVVPPINLHQVVAAESSPASPDLPAPDAADTVSTIPAQGQNYK